MKPLGHGETCAFLPVDAASPGCRQPRACASCLETAGCVVTAVGACASLGDTVLDTSSLDYHTAIERDVVGNDEAAATRPRMRAPQSWQFSASDVRYCNASDAVCSACVSNNFWRSNATAPDSRFCLGDGGACVCVDVCERPWYIREDCSHGGGGASSTVADVLPGGYAAAEYDDTTEKLWRGIMALAATSFILMLIFLRKKCSDEELLRMRRRHARQARQARRTRRSRAIGVKALTLTGWGSYRRDLIDKEKQQQHETDDGEGRSPAQREWSPSTTAERSSEVVGMNLLSADTSSSATNLNENVGTETPSVMSPSGARPALSGSRANRLATYTEATPSQQLLRPLQGRGFGRSNT